MNKKIILLVIVVASVVMAYSQLTKTSSRANWLTNMEEAQKIAAEKDVPILINFTGSDWCSWCHKLRNEVFATEEFINYANENLVLLELDFPRKVKQSKEVKDHNNKYLKMFGVRGFPTIIVVDSKLNILTQLGYQPGGPENYIADMEASIVFPDKNYDRTITTENGIEWTTSFEKAKDEAKATGKAIFVDFTGSDWCRWCTKISEEILSTDEFKKFAKDNLIMLYLDFPQTKELPSGMQPYNQKLASQYGIQGFPTILILDKNGKELARLGYERAGAGKFISDIKKVIQ
jgi:thioredoxin-related protein